MAGLHTNISDVSCSFPAVCMRPRVLPCRPTSSCRSAGGVALPGARCRAPRGLRHLHGVRRVRPGRGAVRLGRRRRRGVPAVRLAELLRVLRRQPPRVPGAVAEGPGRRGGQVQVDVQVRAAAASTLFGSPPPCQACRVVGQGKRLRIWASGVGRLAANNICRNFVPLPSSPHMVVHCIHLA